MSTGSSTATTLGITVSMSGTAAIWATVSVMTQAGLARRQLAGKHPIPAYWQLQHFADSPYVPSAQAARILTGAVRQVPEGEGT